MSAEAPAEINPRDLTASRPTREATRVLLEEARRHLDAQVIGLRELDQKTAEIVRFNLLLIGILASRLSFLVSRQGNANSTLEMPAWVIGLFVLGFLGLLGSALLGILSYLKRDIAIGVKDMESVLTFDVDEDEVSRVAILAYSRGIRGNYRIIEKTAATLSSSLVLMTLGSLLLAAAAITLSTHLKVG